VTAKWIRGDYEGLVVRRVVCEACLSPMTAEEGTSLPDGGVWFWWRCENGHVTTALPAPPREDV